LRKGIGSDFWEAFTGGADAGIETMGEEVSKEHFGGGWMIHAGPESRWEEGFASSPIPS